MFAMSADDLPSDVLLPVPAPRPPAAAVGPRTSDIPYEITVAACAVEGLHALAVLAPPPGALPADGLDRMLADGVGDMGWIAGTRAQRLDPVALLPSARAILLVALPYDAARSDEGLRRARYGAGKDYHNLLRPKLGRVGVDLNRRFATRWRHRAAVDSAPLNERTLARLAGLGWIGRNALLIAPDAGSWRLLGALLTEAPLAPRHGGHGDDRCGSCDACERACPTAALVGGRALSERCISYLTIEHAGVIPRALAERFAGWWFGCDICQEVCPWNRFAGAAGDARLAGRDRDADLLAVTAASFDQHFAGRAVRRIGYVRFRRNLLVALWSLGRQGEYAHILAEGLPLVREQAAELGIG